MSQQKYPKAYEAYQQAVYRDGKNPTFWCSIGVLYYQINQYRDALDAYSRAIRLNPYISEVWYDLGTLVSCHSATSRARLSETVADLSPSTNRATTRLPTRLMPINALLSSTPATLTSRHGFSSSAPAEAMEARLPLPSRPTSTRTLIRLQVLPALLDLSGEALPSSLRRRVPRLLPPALARTGPGACRMSTRHLSHRTPTTAGSSSVDLPRPLSASLALSRNNKCDSSSILRPVVVAPAPHVVAHRRHLQVTNTRRARRLLPRRSKGRLRRPVVTAGLSIPYGVVLLHPTPPTEPTLLPTAWLPSGLTTARAPMAVALMRTGCPLPNQRIRSTNLLHQPTLTTRRPRPRLARKVGRPRQPAPRSLPLSVWMIARRPLARSGCASGRRRARPRSRQTKRTVLASTT